VINITEDSPADDKQPAFSPDGELIAFRSEREGGGIFLMGATGESVRRLTNFGYNPAWSPDGKEIVFATEEIFNRGASTRFSKSQLWIVNVASGERRLLTEGDAVHPQWSPNGSRIAYWRSVDIGQRDIYTLPADGGDAVPVTQDIHLDWNPVWHSGGGYLYFASGRSGSMNLWRVPIDEESGEVLGQLESVTAGASTSHQHLSFTKDGERIAYVELVQSWSMWKVGFDPTSEMIEGEPEPLIPGSQQTLGPATSPDGDWLAFTAFTAFGENEDIYVMRPDGSSRRQLTNDEYSDRIGAWSPDGKRIAFYSNRGGGSTDIWTIRPDGSELLQLTNAPDQALGLPRWALDGLRMSYYDFASHASYIFNLNKPWEEQTPVELPLFDANGEWFLSMCWSPDGRWLAGSCTAVPGRWEGIALYSLETERYRTLTNFGTFPTWLPDGRLLFNSPGAVHMVDIESGNVRDLLSLLPDEIYYTTLSPDQRTLYFTRITDESDIWMLTLSDHASLDS
jgi:Tol biopolymer transport system component